MHGALARVFTDYPVDDDFLLSFVKPALLASKPTGCLTGAGWHEQPSENSNDESQKALILFISMRIEEIIGELFPESLLQ
jgi:hypothetical protein